MEAIDLESKNGTRVNGHYRNQHWLSDGDTLAIGEAHVRFAAEGEPEGPPAGAATAAPASAVPAKPAPGKPAPARPAPAKPVPARPAPAKPAPAAPVAATPAPPAPALPAAPAQPAQAAPARAPSRTPVAPAPSRSRGAAPARKRRAPRDDYYDDEYDDEGDLPPRRRKSNSGPIVIIGILAAAAFLVIMFAIFAGGSSHNLEVFRKADKMADRGQLEEALQYAEQNAEPDGKDYVRVLRGIEKWKKMLTAKKHGEFEKKAREYFDKQIFRHQAVTGRRRGGFRAKDAYADSEVAKLLQQFLLDYPQTAPAQS